EEEKKGIAEDIKEVYAQAKAVGFDTKIMRKVVQIRKMDVAERQEQDSLIDVYLHAIEGGDLPAKAGDDSGEGDEAEDARTPEQPSEPSELSVRTSALEGVTVTATAHIPAASTTPLGEPQLEAAE